MAPGPYHANPKHPRQPSGSATLALRAAVLVAALYVVLEVSVQVGHLLWATTVPPQQATVCPADREGSWSIGVFRGDSPFSLQPLEGLPPADPSAPFNPANPVLTCAHAASDNAAFVAAPFLVSAPDGKTVHMFYELRTHGKVHQGNIAAAVSSDGGATFTYLGVVLNEPWHLSYPFVFEHAGTMWMVPESSQRGSVELYRAEQFPHNWVWHKTLIELPLLAPSLLRHEGQWYLLAAMQRNQQRTRCAHLELWTSPTLSGNWSRGATLKHWHGVRPAGRPFSADGALYRFGTNCSRQHVVRGYGEHVQLFRIGHLEKHGIEEVEVPFPVNGTLRPGVDWNGARRRHVDVVQLPDGSWLAAMDGDAMPEAPSASGRVAKRSLRLLLLAVVAAALLVVTRSLLLLLVNVWQVFSSYLRVASGARAAVDGDGDRADKGGDKGSPASSERAPYERRVARAGGALVSPREAAATMAEQGGSMLRRPRRIDVESLFGGVSHDSALSPPSHEAALRMSFSGGGSSNGGVSPHLRSGGSAGGGSGGAWPRISRVRIRVVGALVAVAAVWLLVRLVWPTAKLQLLAGILWYVRTWGPPPTPHLVGGTMSRLSVLVQSYDARDITLAAFVKHYSRCASIGEIVVVWNAGVPPVPERDWDFPANLPVRVRVEAFNSMNNRFQPDPELRYRPVLMLDDDLLMPCADIERGFARWRRHPERVVSYYSRLLEGDPPQYQCITQCERYTYRSGRFNVVLAGAAFMDSGEVFPAYYGDANRAGREYVDRVFNCDDLLLNYVLAAQRPDTQYADYVRPSMRFDVGKLTAKRLSTGNFGPVRHGCTRAFAALYGNPLLNRSFPLDFGALGEPRCGPTWLGCAFILAAPLTCMTRLAAWHSGRLAT